MTAEVNEIIHSSAAELAERIHRREISSVEVVQAHVDRIDAVEGKIHAFLHVSAERALESARAVDESLARGEAPASALAGVPIALKDLFTTTDMPTTGGSQILDGWMSPYDATVTARIRGAGLPVLGKTNTDEFGMGSSTENSSYGPSRNPWDLSRTPGGSGGGNSAALAAKETPLAVGTDTGGSIRQPAALTSTVGVRPTYGTVSRYGMIACASSLDQGGPCARTVLDTALLHEIIAGYDAKDGTSTQRQVSSVVQAAKEGSRGNLEGLTVGIVRELRGEGYQPGAYQAFERAVSIIQSLGAQVKEVSCPHFPLAMPAYYLILPSEVSSNLSRLDGMRYGARVGDDGTADVASVMTQSRSAGLGPEVKRRIIIGTYALSAGHYDAFYGQAQKVRALVAHDFELAYRQVDVILAPTTPTTAFELGERVDDPVAMYRFDLCTIPTNLAGHPGMSVPAGFSADDDLPVGLQILAPALADDRLYRVGAAYEAARGPLPSASL